MQNYSYSVLPLILIDGGFKKADPLSSKKEVCGTAFVIHKEKGRATLISARHVFDQNLEDKQTKCSSEVLKDYINGTKEMYAVVSTNSGVSVTNAITGAIQKSPILHYNNLNKHNDLIVFEIEAKPEYSLIPLPLTRHIPYGEEVTSIGYSSKVIPNVLKPDTHTAKVTKLYSILNNMPLNNGYSYGLSSPPPFGFSGGPVLAKGKVVGFTSSGLACEAILPIFEKNTENAINSWWLPFHLCNKGYPDINITGHNISAEEAVLQLVKGKPIETYNDVSESIRKSIEQSNEICIEATFIPKEEIKFINAILDAGIATFKDTGKRVKFSCSSMILENIISTYNSTVAQTN